MRIARNNFSPLDAVKRHKTFLLHVRKLLEGKKMRKNIRCARRAYATRRRNFQKFPSILDATVESTYDRYGRPSVNCAASDTPSRNNGRGRMICVFDAPDKRKQSYATRVHALHSHRSGFFSPLRETTRRIYALWPPR